MEKFYFTFGPDDAALHGFDPCEVLVVNAESEGQARDKVFKSSLGNKWCTSYTEDEYNTNPYRDSYKVTRSLINGTVKKIS